MADRSYRIQIVNDISRVGLDRFPGDTYQCGKDLADPDAILVRSADLHKATFGPALRAIGRAGAGTNNIPVAALSLRGVPVFNAPGANANAVKELVLAGMLMAARNLPAAMQFVAGLAPDLPDMDKAVESGKKAFAGFELAGNTLGVIGLGKIGCLVADAAIKLGMSVIGYDPEITVDAAWSLPSQVKKANSIADILRASNFISIHVPLLAATRDLINGRAFDQMRDDAILLNFSREGIVNEEAAIAALGSGRLNRYVCDFPGPALNTHPRVIALPHLGASTRQAEDNCAEMVVDQVMDYLENGNVVNAVNFPNAAMPRESAFRVAIANSNVPNMLGQISTAMADANLNIHNMLNRSRGDMAYTLVDVDSAVPASATDAIARIQGVLSVRYLPS
jgi:D-3-phosphoglycerate dehydrogenase / 2-oxoglutarate reductase